MSNEIINFKKKQIKSAEIKRGNFDFDYWSKLAKNDPEAFEQAREAEINKYIENLEGEQLQERMRRVQWRVEIERARSKNPMEAAARIYDMMWESVGRNVKALDELAAMLNPLGKSNSEANSDKKGRNVLSFAKKI